MSAHTPGNPYKARAWKVWQNPSEEGSNYWRVRTSYDSHDTDNLCGYCGAEAARLIEAASEMFDLLKAEMNKNEMGVQLNPDRPERIKELIQKIEGEK